jgi:hypothetical protein
MPRRHAEVLKLAVLRARSTSARARAHYHLAVFHDRNSREADAIPHYRAALRLGLPAKTRPAALAWLASSLYKTGQPKAALRCVLAAEYASPSPPPRRFLAGLKRRIEKNFR